MSESTGYANVCMLLFMFTAVAAIFPRIQPPTVLFIFGALLNACGPGVTLLWLGICLTWSFWEHSFGSYPWRVVQYLCSKLLQVVRHCFRLLHQAPAFTEGARFTLLPQWFMQVPFLWQVRMGCLPRQRSQISFKARFVRVCLQDTCLRLQVLLISSRRTQYRPREALQRL